MEKQKVEYNSGSDVRNRRNKQIPLSLGKASLRIRLEAYYSLISPETLSDRTVWLRKYDQIYEKYGGTYEGERKLGSKLAKKYGTAVRLLLVADDSSNESSNSNVAATTTTSKIKQKEEDWYQLRPNEVGTGIVDFSSSNFDPVAALTNNRSREEDVYRANTWLSVVSSSSSCGCRSDSRSRSDKNTNIPVVVSTTIMDNIEKCASLLPKEDPLHRETRHQLQLRKNNSNAKSQLGFLSTSSNSNNGDNNNNNKRPRNNNNNALFVHPFESIASHLDSGPHSFLCKLRNERKRITIVIRYVNIIRGTLTGTLIAFDKHMNMIVRDVNEVYSPRLIDVEKKKSNVELEVERRKRLLLQNNLTTMNTTTEDDHTLTVAAAAVGTSITMLQQQQQQQPGISTWNVRRRQMKQLLVRGDMVVSVYEAISSSKERATTNNFVPKSRYCKKMSK